MHVTLTQLEFIVSEKGVFISLLQANNNKKRIINMKQLLNVKEAFINFIQCLLGLFS